jgi:hypothetical protein
MPKFSSQEEVIHGFKFEPSRVSIDFPGQSWVADGQNDAVEVLQNLIA